MIKALIFQHAPQNAVTHGAANSHIRIIDMAPADMAVQAVRQAGIADVSALSQTFGQFLCDAAMDAQHMPAEGDWMIFLWPMPLICPEAIEKAIRLHHHQGNACTAWPGLVLINASAFLQAWPQDDKPQGIEAVYDLLRQHGQAVVVHASADLIGEAKQFEPIETPEQLAYAVSITKKRVNAQHMAQGVFLMDPEHTMIGAQVSIGAGTVIYPGCYLEGKTSVGAGCIVGPSSRIVDSVIADGVKAEYAVVLQSEIGTGTTVGPYAYIRPHCQIGPHCKIGDFVEVKNACIGSHTSASHLTYIGDADVGSGVNFGCGTVTVNYDGIRKCRTIIQDGAFIGCNTNLIAPVTVKAGAYIAAGSTITVDVPEDALAVARARQVNKAGWRKKRAAKA